MRIKHEIACPQWDDQRPEKAIKGVSLSINGRLNTENDLCLRWTGSMTATPLPKSHDCSLISWMTGQFYPLGRVWNKKLLRRETSPVNQRHVAFMYYWFFFSLLFFFCFASVHLMGFEELKEIYAHCRKFFDFLNDFNIYIFKYCKDNSYLL